MTPSTPSADASASDTAATASALKAAFKASLLHSLTSQSPPIPYDAAGAQCVADHLVDHVGVARMERVGVQHVLGEKVTWSVDDATYLATQLVDCAPDNSVVQFFRQRLNDGFGTKITATQKACMDRVVTRDVSIKLLTSEYDGKAAAGQAAFQSLLTSAAPGCGIR
ncbi:hypothetical protein Back2_23680 [Nocardioides baekrokdamisoli]|uniref:Uncharacterized protein n=1 Tax=Nocardioides baekrokdamisoli TaxID=1804624 RepID=A0A3G9IWK6_9ACTN|nr:hypothetical protein Back2_23680 [Nocardioides baekrokdamisoli]